MSNAEDMLDQIIKQGEAEVKQLELLPNGPEKTQALAESKEVLKQLRTMRETGAESEDPDIRLLFDMLNGLQFDDEEKEDDVLS